MYNESAGLDNFLRETTRHLDELEEEYELLCVNDGSTDPTLQMLRARQADYPALRVINLSRNFGKEAALTAGLDKARGDVVVPMDADLQDPPELIPRMLDKHREGYDVVLARRTDRQADGYLKRTTAGQFYRLLGRISHVDIPHNVGDYRLMSRRVLEVLQSLPENQRFMKGIFAWAGFSTAYVDYVRPQRSVGKSRFSGWHLWNFALEGITSFSTLPLRIWTYLGALVAMTSFIYGSWIVIRTLVFGVDLPGYASLITIMLFLGGIQLIGIGMIGEYVGRTYMEVKRRPIYVIESET
jgi:glycosyltransferase involved in cell wall biosynthesis